MKTLVFIALQLSQPRCIKRIETFQKAGFPIKVYGFDSGLYSSSLKNLPFDVEEIITREKNVGRLKKIKFFTSTIRRILKENKTDTMFYLFGYEIASIAWMLGCKNYIYEEADVTASRVGNPIVRNALLAVDRAIIRKSKLTVFTSLGFVKYLFGNKQPKNITLMPNKLSTYFDGEKKAFVVCNKISIDKIKFGFIGLIRYPNTIIRFAKVIGKHYPQHEFHFFGDAEKKEYFDEELKSYKNIFMHGPFENPKDLQSIYSQIDINIVCYDTISGNVRIAEPNKLYESIFFETPIVVSAGTFLEERVNELKVGTSINAANDDSIIAYVNSITNEGIDNFVETMKGIPYTELIDNPVELVSRTKIICE